MIHRIIGNIFLLSLEDATASEDLNKEFGITHVISVLEGPVPDKLKENFQHLQIEVQDMETVNILQHLPSTNTFIDQALTPNSENVKHLGAVLVHCTHGVSRSVTVIMAYLMYKYKLQLAQALHAVKRKSASVQPNEGFMKQLELFQEMGFSVDKLSSTYRQFLAELSLKEDPSGQLLAQSQIFNKTTAKKAPGSYKLRCKRCRQVLANQGDIETHKVPGSDSRQSQFIKTAPNSRRIISVREASSTCSHYFLDEPLEWMQPELEKQEIEGKFACPKCTHKVGGYSWRGSRCSCGKWMVPALHLQSAKVDQMAS